MGIIANYSVCRRFVSGFLPCAALLMIFCTVGQGVAQTFPRQDIRFSSGWKYHLGDVTGAQVPSYSDAGWTPVNLPHYGDGVVAMGKGPTIGYTWYRKTFTVGSSLAGQKIFLEIDAAMQLAYVWVNDTFMRNGAPYTTRIPVAGLGPTPDTCTHRGGYVPFTMDITNYVHQGAGNVIAVRLNSAACGDNSFPPANAAPDFQYWGGLYRDVYLHAMDSLHITDPLYEAIPGSGGVFVSYPTPIVAGAASATVRVQTHVRNEHNSGIPCVLTTDIMTPDTQTVVATISTTQSIPADSTFTFTQTLAVTNPKLWHPLHPNLYIVRSRVYNNTTPADLEYTTIGIRTIRMLPSPGEAAGGLFINGQNFYANGADRHQDAPYIGNATPASGQYRDALLLKQAGFNFVRTCHYVQSPFFIRACDKLGVCVMSCLPGWQHTSTVAGFVNNSYNDIRDMIRLYRNDPAVIMWEIAHNESGDAQSYTITANADANQEYPFDTIYTGGEIGNATCAASNVGYGYKIIYSSDQHGALGCPTTMTKPMNITEYADWNFSSGGQRSARSPEMNTVRLCNNQITNESLNRSVTPASGDADIPFVGDEVWTAFDYNLVGIVRSGVVDWARIPKMGWYAYKSQMDTGTVIGGIGGAVQGPMVYIANWWASAAVVGTASANNPVRVFSNCDSVAMYVSGTLVAKQGPDIVAGTGSAAGGSGVYDSIMFLHHRPFTFNLSAYTPGTGTLRADGYLGGVVRASDTVRPPVAAARLVVTIDTATLRFQADSSDIAYVHAAIVDTNGTLMPTATNAVTFTVTTGSGAILIQPVTEAGIATTMLQAGATPGLITVTATATGLKSDSATVESVAPSSNPTGIARSFRPLAATGTAAFSIHRNGSTLFLYTPLSSAGNSSGTTFSLFSAEGRLLLKRDLAGGVTAVKMSSLPHGLYLGQLANNGGKFMQKIVW